MDGVYPRKLGTTSNLFKTIVCRGPRMAWAEHGTCHGPWTQHEIVTPTGHLVFRTTLSQCQCQKGARAY
eukprot:1341467-Rhodomonas_salina.1